MAVNQDKLIEVFSEALDKAPPEERERYLAQACGEERELRRQVDSLLQAQSEAGSFLHQPVVTPEGNGPSAVEGPGTVIGRYKLLQQIGEGGFGLVFMAEQLEPVRRMVALKIIKAGMDTREVIARFEAERQALALMDHPNIARVLDGGTTVSGRPYFVMDLVKGIPITDFCDQNQLPTEARLRLFMQVCAGVQHAHQKGIIHRDLKPSNVLVTVQEGQPVPKVIDFGIAKAIGQKLTERTLFTRFEQLIGTPAYMSPEQAEWGGTDIDTRSDIYSLGALLYELLTGTTPFDKETLARAALDEVRRMIRETEPPTPSMRLQGLGQRLNETAQRRHAEPSLLPRLVRGDLDWIAMKALEKDRARRYETANGLAMDVQRHLNNEPVVARPPSRLYEFQKTVRRHKVGFSVAGVVAAALVTGLGLSTWSFYKERAAHRQAVEAREQAYANFQMARDTLDQMLTRLATGLAGEPRMVQLRRTLLEDALKFYQQFVQRKGDDPALRYDLARAYLRVGQIYMWCGEYNKVLAPAEQALVMLDELARQHPTEPRYRVGMLEAHSRLGYAEMWFGRSAEVIAHARSRVGVCEDLRREFPGVPEYLYLAASAHDDLGVALRGGAPRESLNELRQALKLYESHRDRFPNVPEDRARLGHIRHWLGSSLEENGQYEEAEREYRQSIELRTQLIREQPQDLELQDDLAHVKDYLAGLLTRTGRTGEAEELLQEVVAVNEQGLNDQLRHAESARRAGIVHRELGDLLLALHRTAEAEKSLRRAVELHGELAQNLVEVPAYRVNLADDQYTLGVLLEATGRSAEAAEAFRKTIKLYEQVIVENPHWALSPRSMGWWLVTCPAVQFRDPQRALALAWQAIQRTPEQGDAWELLGVAQYRSGQPSAATESLRKALELTDGGEPEQWFFLALAYWQNQNHQQAWEWYSKATAWIEKHHPANEALDRFRAEAGAVLRTEQ